MKFLAREARYFVIAAMAGMLLMPALLWAIDWLLQLPATAAPGRLLSGYREYYGALDEAVTWLWVLTPYSLFTLMRLLFRGRRPDPGTDIGRAAKRGEVAEVESLVESGADVNAANASGQTPLHLAAANGDADMVRVLIEDGAEFDMPDSGAGLSALHVAAQCGHERVVDLLVRYGADLEARTLHQQTPLHLAALHGQSGVTAQLLKYHVKLDRRDAEGMTALQLAEENGHRDVVGLIADYTEKTWPYLHISNG